MKKIRKTDLVIVLTLLALIAAAALWFGNQTAPETVAPADSAVRWQDYNGRKIGILSGTNMEAESQRFFPDSEYFYFDGYSGLNAALLSGRIDAYLTDEPVMKSTHVENPDLDYLRERLTENRYSFAFRKNDPREKALLDQFNAFLKSIHANGVWDEIEEIWFGVDESRKVVDMTDLASGENGVIHVVTTSTDPPFSYLKDGLHVGYDIDVAARFCRAYGYGLEIGDVDFPARIPALQSGRYEFTTTLNVTSEREESVLFSDAVSEGGIVVAVRSADLAGGAADGAAAEENPGFFRGMLISFEKNFLRENRWKLILRGVGVTCLITLLSTIFGTLLAFLICLFRRTDSLLANRISDFYVKLLQGTPIVVLLMILYYVIFARTTLSAVTISVIGFSMNFAAYTSEIMRAGIDSVDPGQREAALAIGYTETRSFFRFIFPQAVIRFLPVYRGEVVALLKSTSIVGYIAIQDLTKMSDIVRSRTYEAFFPLISTALIYFLLSWIISAVLKKLLEKINPRSRKNREREATAK